MTQQQEHELYIDASVSMITTFLNNIDNEETYEKTINKFVDKFRLDAAQECSVRLALFSIYAYHQANPFALNPDNEQANALVGFINNIIADILIKDYASANNRLSN